VSQHALSYAWGDLEITRPSHVNEDERQVTTNLYHALRRLRKESEPRTIWIDSLCIDQANTQEKNHQVGMMGEIHRSTQKVLIWIGEPGMDEKIGNTPEEKAPRLGPPVEWGAADDDTMGAIITDAFLGDETISSLDPFVGAFIIFRCFAGDSHITTLPFFSASHFAEKISEDELRKASALGSLPCLSLIIRQPRSFRIML